MGTVADNDANGDGIADDLAAVVGANVMVAYCGGTLGMMRMAMELVMLRNYGQEQIAEPTEADFDDSDLFVGSGTAGPSFISNTFCATQS